MPSAPRILRVTPEGLVTRPENPPLVTATLHWRTGGDADVDARALAWTREAVEVEWFLDGADLPRSDWIPAADVRRRGEPPRRRTPADDPPRAPGGGRPRW